MGSLSFYFSLKIFLKYYLNIPIIRILPQLFSAFPIYSIFSWQILYLHFLVSLQQPRKGNTTFKMWQIILFFSHPFSFFLSVKKINTKIIRFPCSSNSKILNQIILSVEKVTLVNTCQTNNCVFEHGVGWWSYTIFSFSSFLLWNLNSISTITKKLTKMYQMK